MKFLVLIFFLILTWFSNTINAKPISLKTGEKIAKIVDNILEPLMPYYGNAQPQWSLSMGDMDVKIGTQVENRGVEISKIDGEVRVVVNGAENVAFDVANATEKQLDDIFVELQNRPPFKYAPNTLEHKAERWAQYKIRLGNDAKDYSAWSNTYNANMTKARAAHQAADEVMASIGWGQREVTVQAGTYTRRMDIADKVAKKGVEVKSYETGKVYATEAIKGELNADKFLINNDFWQIEWIFKGCEPSQPLRTLLEQASITIKLVP